MNRENIHLLHREAKSGLSLFFATLCIVDIFGVFPIIALPRAIIQCGWFGIPLVISVFALQIYTATLLGKSWSIAVALDPRISRKSRNPLAAVTELTLGSRARTCVTLLLDLTVFGGGIPNLLVASQNLQLFGLKISDRNFDLSFCYWLLIVGVLLCPVMWLGSPRDMKWLATCSCTIVATTAVLIWWCIVTSDVDASTAVSSSPSWEKMISGYGMLAFQFDVHPALMTVQVDMRRPTDIHRAIVCAFLASGTLFGVTAGLAVWKYSGATTANILQLNSTGFPINFAILLAALQLCLSSAVGHSALFQHLEDKFRVERSFSWKRCAVRSAVVFFGVALGESVPRFDIVMSLIGGTLTGPLIFVLPPLMYSRARALRAFAFNRDTLPVGVIKKDSAAGDDVAPENDPRVHSRSTYYGLPENPTRYSHIYYVDEEEEEEEQQEQGIAANELGIPLTHRAAAARSASQRRRLPCRNFFDRKDWFGYCVVFVGISITISSTYINVKNTMKFVRFTPPCIVNASFAAIDL